MSELTTVSTITTVPGYTVAAVVYDGSNIDQVRSVVSHTLGPGTPEFTPWPQAVHPPLIRLWDSRTTDWRFAKPGDCIIADTQGVLVLDRVWAQTLFRILPDADQLALAAILSSQLQQVIGQLSVAAAEQGVQPDPDDVLSAQHLQPAALFPYSPNGVPAIEDVWIDRFSRSWTVVHTGSEPQETLLDNALGERASWEWLSNSCGPLRFAHHGISWAA